MSSLAARTGLLLVLSASVAAAQDTMPPAGGVLAEDEEAPPPPVVLRAIPPRYSWDFAFQVSYGQVPEFLFDSPFVGFGLRGGWGKHYGSSRVGVGLDVAIEGAVTVRWAHVLEPAFQWDYVHKKGLYLGASVGPVVAIGLKDVTHRFEVLPALGPMAAFRIGYSQAWSMTSRRFFVAVEPKFRWTADLSPNGDGVSGPSWMVSIVIGSGRGY